MIDQVFYLMNNLVTMVVIFTLYFDIKNAFFYWGIGDWMGTIFKFPYTIAHIWCKNARKSQNGQTKNKIID